MDTTSDLPQSPLQKQQAERTPKAAEKQQAADTPKEDNPEIDESLADDLVFRNTLIDALRYIAKQQQLILKKLDATSSSSSPTGRTTSGKSRAPGAPAGGGARPAAPNAPSNGRANDGKDLGVVYRVVKASERGFDMEYGLGGISHVKLGGDPQKGQTLELFAKWNYNGKYPVESLELSSADYKEVFGDWIPPQEKTPIAELYDEDRVSDYWVIWYRTAPADHESPTTSKGNPWVNVVGYELFDPQKHK